MNLDVRIKGNSFGYFAYQHIKKSGEALKKDASEWRKR